MADDEALNVGTVHDLPAKNGEHMALLGQLARYGVTGLLASLVNIGIYHGFVMFGGFDPNLAWAIGFLGAAAAAYILHGEYSFRGQGSRDRQHVRISRFIIVSIISFGLNSLWVWLLVQFMSLPIWTPYPMVLCVTPLLVFWLNRHWVFE